MEKAIPKWCALFYVLFVIVDGATLPRSLIHSRKAFDKLEDDASFWSHFDKPSSANFEDDGFHARVKVLDADKVSVVDICQQYRYEITLSNINSSRK